MSTEETYEFDLVFSVPGNLDEADLVDRLFVAGCDDAVIGLGTPGLVAVSLERRGSDAESAIAGAARQIAVALPADSELREVRPDLVSQADVAARLGVSRQALQKRHLPPPSVAGLYRADELYPYLERSRGKLKERVHAARGWFRASGAAKRLNARLALGEIRFGKNAG
jgi:hypothetical protein